jgi:CBS domain-containing protein
MKTLKAKDLMTTDVLTVRDDWPIEQLADFLSEHAISGAPVVSTQGKPLGVVSLTDMARFRALPLREDAETTPHSYFHPPRQTDLAGEELTGFQVEAEPTVNVGEIMTPVIFDIDENATVQEVAETMLTGHIHRLLVTRDTRLVGIISAFDLLKAIRDSV